MLYPCVLVGPLLEIILLPEKHERICSDYTQWYFTIWNAITYLKYDVHRSSLQHVHYWKFRTQHLKIFLLVHAKDSFSLKLEWTLCKDTSLKRNAQTPYIKFPLFTKIFIDSAKFKCLVVTSNCSECQVESL